MEQRRVLTIQELDDRIKDLRKQCRKLAEAFRVMEIATEDASYTMEGLIDDLIKDRDYLINKEKA